MYIKTFRFRVSNPASSAFADDKDTKWYKERMAEIVTEAEITKKINHYINTSIADREVVDIKITPVDVNYHNNGRGNTVDLIYTIMYK